MKIVQINAVYKYSSTGRTTMEMHEYCKQNNIRSYVFCTNYSEPENNVFYVGCQLDHKLHALWSRIFGKQGCFSKQATIQLTKKLDTIKPDVVILRNLHANYINLSVLLSYLAKEDIATIVVMHDCWFFTGHCTHYTSHRCAKWRSECDKCKLMNLDNKSLFFDTSKSMFHLKKSLFDKIPRLGVVGVSDWITGEARKSVILNSAIHFQRIYNWIDKNKFYPRETTTLRQQLGLTDEFVVLGVAQSWSWKKGLAKFVELALRLPDIRIILVGAIAEQFEIPSNILTPGLANDIDTLAEYYSLAETMLVCSIQETFGKVSAEALACGTPLIVNNATANPEIPGAACGYCVEDNNIDQIVEYVEKIRRDGKQHYSMACVERAYALFNKDENIKQYIDFCEILSNYR